MPPLQFAPLRRAAASAARAARPSSRLAPVMRSLPALAQRIQPASSVSRPPASTDRGPASDESTVTDFQSLDVLGGTPVPSTSIDACLWDGFHLNNGVKITNGTGVLLVAGEAFAWRPWKAARVDDGRGEKSVVNKMGVFEVGPEAWGVLGLVWPKPGMSGRVPGNRSEAMLTEWLRSTDSWCWTKHDAIKSSDETSHQQPWHSS